MLALYDWQKTALSELIKAGGGIIEAATGTGKTLIGLKLIFDNPSKRTLVVVPTIALQDQWAMELVKNGVVNSHFDISFIGGGNSGVPKATGVTIAVVNSLRNVNWKSSLAQFDIVILDECHRYASEKNVSFLREGNFGFKCGLTATLRRSDGKESCLREYIGGTVYKINTTQAVDAGLVCDYDIHTIPCGMTAQEQQEYSEVDKEVKSLMGIFNHNYNSAKAMLRSFKHPNYKYAVQLMKAVGKRKSLLIHIASKRDMAVNLVMQNRGKKVIMFDETIDNASQIHEALIAAGIKSTFYHSGMKRKDKADAITQFKGSGEVLMTVRALDEGLNVKDAVIGMIVNGNSQPRQIIQRLGRILRKDGDKKATLYMLYCPETKDEQYVDKRLQYI